MKNTNKKSQVPFKNFILLPCLNQFYLTIILGLKTKGSYKIIVKGKIIIIKIKANNAFLLNVTM